AAVSQALGIYGPQATFSTACSSSALAVALAADAIRRGEARIALALGADGLCRLTYAGFDALQALDPDRCRPFDRHRQGLSLGDGAAALILVDAEHARARGARARAILLGSGTATDAPHLTAPPPAGAVALAEVSLPPTVGLRETDTACADLGLVPVPGRRAALGVALTSSYGFGGHSVTLVLGRAGP